MPIYNLLSKKAAGASALPRSATRICAVYNPASSSAVKLTPAALKKLKKSQLVELGAQLGLSLDIASRQVKQQLVDYIINNVSSSDEDSESYDEPARAVDISSIRTVEDVPQSLAEAMQLPTSLLEDLAANDLGFPNSVTRSMDKEELIMKLWLGKPYNGSSPRPTAADVPLYMEDAHKLSSAMSLPASGPLNLKAGDDVPETLEEAMRVPTSQLVDMAKNRLGFPTSVTSAMDKEELIMKLWLGKPYKPKTDGQQARAQAKPKSSPAPVPASRSAAVPAQRSKAPAKSANFSIPQSMDAAMAVPKAELVDLATQHLGYQRKAAEAMEKEDLIMKLWLAQPSVSSTEYDYKFDINNLEDVERPSTAHSDAHEARKSVRQQPSFNIPQSLAAAMEVPTAELVDLAVEHLDMSHATAEAMEKEDLIMKLWLAQPSLDSSDYDYDFDINNLEHVERPSTAVSVRADAGRHAPVPSFDIPQSMDAAMQMPTAELVDLAVEHLDMSRSVAEGMEKEDIIMKLWLAQPSISSSEYDYDFDINNLEDVERPSTAVSVRADAGRHAPVPSFDIPQSMDAALELSMDELVDMAVEHLDMSRSVAEGMEKEDIIMKLWLAQPSVSSTDFDFDFDINNLEDVERPSASHDDIDTAAYGDDDSHSSSISLEDVPQSMEEALQVPTSLLEDLAVEELGYPRMYIEGMEKEDLIQKLWDARE